ncbi:hypothetical protein ALC57_17051 [Trachymyrmex cornetzi]|uniref:Uncharacterized protein n=1 Tax=Trachymyrmex cornetzi TaxID=471704 RepID=A0A195DD99_9HYME|nr:hypothetical protein ALC57_17051 [Trachymyrmex cornetzi]
MKEKEGERKNVCESLVAGFLINVISRFREKKSFTYRLLSYITLPGEEIIGRNPKVSVKVKEASCKPAVSFALVTPLFRP